MATEKQQQQQTKNKQNKSVPWILFKWQPGGQSVWRYSGLKLMQLKQMRMHF